ncbi:MAG: septum formation family protein [Acidobacteria bacterium]|nr:septum formation family protein [Acidobacteriota bacterium]
MRGIISSSEKRRRRRWALTVSALGLVLAACTSASDEPASSLPEVIPSTTSTTEAQVPEPEVPETTAPDEGYLWSVGDCVDLGADAAAELPYAPYGTGLLLECAEPHTHEVYFTATLSGGSDAPFPDDLNDRLFDVCFVEFAEVMGFSSSNSTLNVLLYLPDAEEWAAGERYHACVVYQSGTDASYSELVGAVADDPGTYTWQVSAGSCYDVDNPQLLAVSTPVDCVEEHSIEMIGEAVLAPDDAIYPGTEAIDRDADEACDALLAEYAVQPLENLPVLTFPLPTPFSEGEWDTGQRTVRCFAFASTLDQGLLVVVGSLGEGTFEIVEIDRGVQV